MPYSHDAPKGWCTARIRELDPRHVLDVGPGAGTWAALLRENRHPVLDCIEAHGPYVERFRLGVLYDHVFVGDVRQWDWGGCDYVTVAESDTPVGQGIPKWTWDLIILGDVLEHMTKPEALAVVDQALAHTDAVLVVVPVGEWPQGPEEGNPLEAHVSTWDEADVLALPKLRRTTHYETVDGWIAAALLGMWP
jgi:SAM-dependent methyltransferase